MNINKNTQQKQIPLLNLLSNCISAKSAPQILSIKDDCTFLFSNFLITALCSSSASSLFCMISYLTAPPTADLSTIEAVFLSINYKLLKLDLSDTHHI